MIEYMLDIHYDTPPQPCDEATFYALCGRPDVAETCGKVKLVYERLPGNPTKEQLRKAAAEAGELKRTLPALLLQGTCNGKPRKRANATTNGWVMMDIDHIRGEPPSATWRRVEAKARALGCALAHVTPSGQGLRLVMPWPMNCPGVAEAQTHYARELGLPGYDGCVKDFSRLSFVVPPSYLLLVDRRLFGPPPETAVAFMAAEIARGAGREGVDVRHAPPSPRFPPSLVPPAPAGGAEKGSPGEASPGGQAAAGAEGGDKAEGEFDGVPMERIVEGLLAQHGRAATGPVVGDRNNTLYLLARDLRYLCDFSAQAVARALPRWGLDEREAAATVASAVNSPRNPGGAPRRIERLVAKLRREAAEEKELDGDGDWQDDGDDIGAGARLFADGTLPPLIADMAALYPPEFRAAAVMAALPIIGTLATRLRATYLDGRDHSPEFITCIVAPQASGKSFAADMAQTLLAPLERADERGRAAEREWMETRRRLNGRGEAPPDPRAVVRIVSATTSNSMLLKRMDYAQGHHLFTLCDEIDTLTRANRAGAWSQKDDLLRQAFDNSVVGQDYISDDSWTTRVNLFYNLLLCGTPGAVARFFDDVEGGLVSRVCFARLPDRLGLPMPRFRRLPDGERARVEAKAEELMAASGPSGETIAIGLPLTLAAIEAWSEERRREYMETQADTALEVFRRRAAVIGFRAGLVAAALDGRRDGERAAAFARSVATHALAEQTALFGQRLNKAAADKSEAAPPGTGARLYSLLPADFTVADVAALRRAAGLPPGGSRMMVQRWARAGMAAKGAARGRWRKIKK